MPGFKLSEEGRTALYTDLTAELDDNLVEHLPAAAGGFAYMQGAIIIEQLNALFGFEGWAYEVKKITAMEGGEGAGWFYAEVRLSVDGAGVRDDVGVGVVNVTREGSVAHDAEQKAIKSAVTDGLKRAARTFGEQFGNRLYLDD